jgi:hypothetical protein
MAAPAGSYVGVYARASIVVCVSLALWWLLLSGCRLRNIRDLQSKRSLEANEKILAAAARIRNVDIELRGSL